MKILYNIPSLESVYAARFIYEGYRNAFSDLGHEFKVLTSTDDLNKILEEYSPDIFFYSINFYTLKFLDLDILEKYRRKGLVVFCQIRAWKSLDVSIGIVSSALKDNHEQVNLIKNGKAGDIFWHWFEPDEPLMDGFTETTGHTYHSILLAADKIKYFYEPDPNFNCDVCYVGSFLSSKARFFNKCVIPLKNEHNVKIYGSDWTVGNKILGKIQKIGQFFNINFLKRVRKIGLSLDEERKLYSSATISLNVHEEHVKRYGMEINERTFKIIACGGFEICDNATILRKYFTEDELVIAENEKEWFEKIEYYLKNPEKRLPIMEAGRKKVLEKHTYHNRVGQILDIYDNFKKNGNKK